MIFLGILLILASAFFVAAEYAIVSARRSKIEPSARKGNPIDRLALRALENQPKYVAGTQICITVIGIAVGAVLTEDLDARINSVIPPFIPDWGVSLISILLITYPLVVLGELVPKYLSLQFAEGTLRFVIGPLRFIVILLKPFIWLLEVSGHLVLKLFKIDSNGEQPTISREELYYHIRAGQTAGGIEENQADFITKTLRLDQLDAEDAMLHRLDIKWLEADLTADEVIQKLREIPHSRIPVCHGDLDDMVGIVYVNDVLKHFEDPSFALEKIVRPAVYVPESLTLNRLVEIMRQTKTQIVIVQDEYGGTRGLVTLEDIIEEIFGDLEDTMESERPQIERTSAGRLSVKGDVRYDELLDYLDIEASEDDEFTTESLAAIIVDQLGRTPRVGDMVELTIGRLRVEQAARHRITRIGVYLPQPSEAE
ncbi:hemolysin family protein [Kamptonema cortianum]|nr:hemolysin family protein [Geitlerinema splendidum]MDK3161203.1 hemolysin family protein [Kamptonema cortianum]